MRTTLGLRAVRVPVCFGLVALWMACSEPTKPDTTPVEIAMTAVDTLRSIGATAALTAAVKNAGGETIPGAGVNEWQSSDPGILTVGSTGIVTAVSNGSVFVRARAGGALDSVPVVVRQRVDVTKSTITLVRPLLFVQDTVRATLQARDALNNAIAFGGATVVFSTAGSATGPSLVTLLPTADLGNGAYSADVIGGAMGTSLAVNATIDGTAIPVSPTVRVIGFTKIAAAGGTLSGTQTTTGGFTCGIITTGQMYCWGIAWFGVRGNGLVAGIEANPIPTLVSGSQQWTDVDSDTYFVCALASGGAAYCWGDGDVGQIGNGESGSPPDVRTPAAVFGGNAFASISIGTGNGVCGVTLANNAMCWGEGTWGRLGNGGENLSAVPVTVSGGFSFAAVATSYSGSCGIAASSAYCWGHWGVLGLGNAPAPETCTPSVPCARTPVAVAGGHAFRPIIAREGNVACAIGTDDKTYCWGAGYVGNGTTGSSEPGAVSGGLTFTSLTAADAGFCGTVVGGAAYCWGANRSGRLGNNSTSEALVPVPVSGGHTFTQLTMSQDHACGIVTDGNAWCWGGNDKGELGTRTLVASLVPVRVKLFAP